MRVSGINPQFKSWQLLCLAPIFTLIGIVGILQGSKKPDTKPKILVFGPGGLPTTEELYNSINQIEKKEVSASLAPDPWMEGSQTEPKVVESLQVNRQDPQTQEILTLAVTGKDGTRVELLRMVYSGVHYPTAVG